MATNPKPDGGPAYPGFQDTSGYGACRRQTDLNGDTVWENYHPGMTLRDWFASQIIASGVLDLDADGETVAAAAKSLGIQTEDYDCRIHWPLLRAKRAYAGADALIQAREA